MNTHIPGTQSHSIYFGEEHELLRAQIRRFVDEEIKPRALQWEQDGMVPRDVLRKMGELGFLGIRYAEVYGGSDMDTLATVVRRRASRRRTGAVDIFRSGDHGAGSYRYGVGASVQFRLG